MRPGSWLIAGAATVLLAAGSVAALAATGAGPTGGPAACTVPSLARQAVQVILADVGGTGGTGMGGTSGMMGGQMRLGAAPPTVTAGTVSFVAANHGARTHELLVLPLPAAGPAVGSRPVTAANTVAETGSLGEASRDCGAGHGDGIAPGQAGWVTLTLRPGRYELLCNQPGHYAAGMYAEFDVT